MKLLRLVPACLLAAITLAVPALSAYAQAPAASPPSAPGSPAVVPTTPEGGGRVGRGGRGGEMVRRMMENLTPEEQTRVRTARRATAKDPAVAAARRALMQAERDAMLKQDPTLGPVLDRLRPPGRREGGASQRVPGAGEAPREGLATPAVPAQELHGRGGLAMLTPDERSRLTNAHRVARQDPAVISARQAMQAATAPEARCAARQTMQEALRAAMLRVDAGIGPILEKAGRGTHDGPGRA